MDQTTKNLLQLDAFDYSLQAKSLFEKSMVNNFQLIKNIFPQYKSYVERRGSSFEYPPIYLPLLKEFSFDLPPTLKIVETITSSGSHGKPTEIPLGQDDLNNRISAIIHSYTGMGILPLSCHAYCFMIPPSQTKMAGSVIINLALQHHKNIKKLSFAFRIDQKGMHFNQQIINEIVNDIHSKIPTLIVGYPALIFEAIKNLKKMGIDTLSLAEGSFILTGGGWKSFLPDVNIENEQFKSEASRFFKIPKKYIRDMFGLSESPVIFLECEKGCFHIPNFCRVTIYDPLENSDLIANKEGEGLMCIESPLSLSYPLLSILTTDKIRLYKNCSCQNRGPSFTPLGRVSFVNYKTCAMKIDSLIGVK